jgi:hypothetical protein
MKTKTLKTKSFQAKGPKSPRDAASINSAIRGQYHYSWRWLVPDTQSANDRSHSDTGWWLSEYQKLLTNLHHLVTHGYSERAAAEIIEMKRRWAEATNV